MKNAKVRDVARECLANFYEKRIKNLDRLALHEVLKRKNPYLYRATGIQDARTLIRHLLHAYVSASEEGVFANEFFEPLFKGVVRGVRSAGVAGADFTRETRTTFEAIALKSGPNIFNSDQVKKQNDRFDEMRRSLNATLRSKRKQFVPILGSCYGQRNDQPTSKRQYYRLAGQAFWEHFVADGAFYSKLVRLMGNPPKAHRTAYGTAWNRAVSRFTREFVREFCTNRDQIDWGKLVIFNSQSPTSKRLR